MAIQIALFRGINVGKAKRIAMVELKAMFEDLGFSNVRTLLNSGNVIFDAGRSPPATNARRIAAALAERTGISANTLVLHAKTLDATIAGNPFADRIDDPSQMLIGFYIDDADRAPFEALQREFPDEAFTLGAHACYLWCPDGILENALAERLLGPKFRDLSTTRNWATTLKVQAMVRE